MKSFFRKIFQGLSQALSKLLVVLKSYQSLAAILSASFIVGLLFYSFSQIGAFRNTRTQGFLRAAKLDSAMIAGGYPDSVNYLLGKAALEKDSLSQATDYFLAALRAHPDFAEAYASLGDMAMRQAQRYQAAGNGAEAQGQIDAALRDYLRALQRKPDLFSAQFGQANALFARGRADTSRAAALVDLNDANRFYAELKNRTELYQLLKLQDYIQVLDNLADLQKLPVIQGLIDESYMQKAPIARDFHRRLGNRAGAIELVEAQYALLQGARSRADTLSQKARVKDPRNADEITRIYQQNSAIVGWNVRTAKISKYEPLFRFNRFRTGRIDGDGIVRPMIKWRTRLGPVGVVSPITYQDKIIQVAPAMGGIAFLNRSNGGLLRLLPKQEGFSQSTPAITAENLWLDAPIAEMYVLPLSQSLNPQFGRFEASAIKLNYFQKIQDSSPLVLNGRVLFGTRSGQFFSAAMSQGSRRITNWFWSSPLGGEITAPAVAGDSLAMFGSSNGRFYGANYREYNRTTYELRTGWIYTTSDTNAITASACFAKGVVYFGDRSGIIHALSEKLDKRRTLRGQNLQGTIAIFRKTGAIIASPAVDDSLVYFCSMDSAIYAFPTFDLKNRKTDDDAPRGGRWGAKYKYKADGAIASSPCITGGVLYVGTDAGEILALDAGNISRLLWRLVVGGPVKSSPVVINQVLYVAADDGYLYAIGK